MPPNGSTHAARQRGSRVAACGARAAVRPSTADRRADGSCRPRPGDTIARGRARKRYYGWPGNPLNRTNADLKLRGNLPNTAARLPNWLLQGSVDSRSTKDRSGRSRPCEAASHWRGSPLCVNYLTLRNRCRWQPRREARLSQRGGTCKCNRSATFWRSARSVVSPAQPNAAAFPNPR